MLDFFRDFMYVLAGVMTIYQYRVDEMESVDNLTVAVIAYGFIAILFQFFSHIFERIRIKKLNKVKKLNKDIFIIIISFVLSFIITQCFIPIPLLNK